MNTVRISSQTSELLSCDLCFIGRIRTKRDFFLKNTESFVFFQCLKYSHLNSKMDTMLNTKLSEKIDVRYVLIFVVFALLVFLILTQTSKTTPTSHSDDDSFNAPVKLKKYVKGDDLTKYINENAKNIEIDETIYQKMLDAVTNYSLTTSDYDKKLAIIYMATMHLFDMNYEYSSVKRLDDSLVEFPYIPNHVSYPSGNMHENIQKAVITHISKHLTSSERQLSTVRETDREMLDIYLRSLFRNISVMKQS
ncbi:hypothetical protein YASMINEVIRUS_1078 [Yasminevirus sp. GU-2018]|uniref:Uncharacterized protein n=1 Tax=Yasminevirus sp. GU-2018 TaxID=2420051 RepID=A0A5K0UA55_9VIRU|nr:hypothetical protein YASMINEVIRUS_1078 [Yasminevirus sp. GU-2018]